jgi:hypothetical protein
MEFWFHLKDCSLPLFLRSSDYIIADLSSLRFKLLLLLLLLSVASTIEGFAVPVKALCACIFAFL